MSAQSHAPQLFDVGALATLAYAAHQMRDRKLAANARRHLEQRYGFRLFVIRKRRPPSKQSSIPPQRESVGDLATLAYAAHQMRDRKLAAIAREDLEKFYGLRLHFRKRSEPHEEVTHAN